MPKPAEAPVQLAKTIKNQLDFLRADEGWVDIPPVVIEIKQPPAPPVGALIGLTHLGRLARRIGG